MSDKVYGKFDELTASNGIYLGNTANAAANVLDWYEEGLFASCNLIGSTSGSFAGVGKYTRIGNRVFIDVEFAAITTANKPLGTYTIGGVPFVVGAGGYPGATCNTERVTFTEQIKATLAAGTSAITLSQPLSNNTSSPVTDANFVNASPMYLRIQMNYIPA